MPIAFKELIRLLNVRDDLAAGKINPKEVLQQLSDEQFKIAFWACADMFKTLKAEAERRDLWKDLITKRDVVK